MTALPPQTEADRIAVAKHISRIQGAVIGAMSVQGVDIPELARRIKSTPAAVSHALDTEDLHIGTATLMFWALGLKWRPEMEKEE